jgi:hypothetical protein
MALSSGHSYVLVFTGSNSAAIMSVTDVNAAVYPAYLDANGVITAGALASGASGYMMFSGSQANIYLMTGSGVTPAPVFPTPVVQVVSGAALSVGQTVTGPPGSSAQVTNVGSALNVVLDFVIPPGGAGPIGPEGPMGPTGLSLGIANATYPAATITVFEGEITDISGTPSLDGLYQSSSLAVSSSIAAGDITVTAAQLAGGYFADRGTQVAAFTITTDTAVNILAVMPNAAVGTSFKLRFINNDQSSVGYAGTLTGGSGVTVGTILPNPAVGQGNWEDYIFTFTAVGTTPAINGEAVGGTTMGLL